MTIYSHLRPLTVYRHNKIDDILFSTSQKKVTELQKWTKAGIEAKGAGERISQARNGKKYAYKKSIEAKEIILKHSLVFAGTLQDKEVATLAYISRNIYYKYKAKIEKHSSSRYEKTRQ